MRNSNCSVLILSGYPWCRPFFWLPWPSYHFTFTSKSLKLYFCHTFFYRTLLVSPGYHGVMKAEHLNGAIRKLRFNDAISLGAIQKVCHRPRGGRGSSKIVTKSEKGGGGSSQTVMSPSINFQRKMYRKIIHVNYDIFAN